MWHDSGGRQKLLVWDLWNTMTCLCACALCPCACELAENEHLPRTSITYKPAPLVHLKGGTKMEWMRNFLECVSQGKIFEFFMAVIECLKILWRWLESAFLLFPILCVRGNEWDCSHPCFIIQEQGSLNRAEDQWVISFWKELIFFPLYIMYSLWNSSIEITRSKA